MRMLPVTCLLLSVLVACASESKPTPGTDPTPDMGSDTTSDPTDTGNPDDTGNLTDTGNPVDMSEPEDTGHPDDTGTPEDMAPTPDTSPDMAPTPDMEPDTPPTFWQPAPGTTWQIQYEGNIDTSLDVQAYNLDMFDTDAAVIDQLHQRNIHVMCYFSAGSWEEWRPDQNLFPEATLGQPLDGWPGERWFDIRAQSVRDLLTSRLDLARDKGCDAVDPDNINGFSNDTGFPLTREDQLDFNRFLATEAHARGLSIGLKNAQDLANELAPTFDWALNEECIQYEECDIYTTTFLSQNKAVFNIEYEGSINDICATANRLGLDTLKKNLNLDASRQSCD